ncbi:MAG TPA: hypothetical protein VJU80_02925 [Solirubrobacteraceae bacterium]|nr:hypothetical protein [Solirubrobacteraceae bacterium]
MIFRAPRLPLSLDPLIAEAKRRMRRRRLLMAALVVALAGGAGGAGLALRGTGPGSDLQGPVAPRPPAQHIGAGPFVLSGGFAGGAASGLWGDGGSGPNGSTLGCIDRRHYSQALGIQNRSHAPVTLTQARGANPAPTIVDLVAVQFRLSPPQQQTQGTIGWGGGLDLNYRRWSAAPTKRLTLPPGRIATVQSNYVFSNCKTIAPGQTVVVPGSLVLVYRESGHVHQKEIPMAGQRIVLVPGPTRHACDPVSGAVTLVAADTRCDAARKAALACHPMSHNSWGDCTVESVNWDCGSTAGAGFPYLETCDLPAKKSHWFRVRWNPPILSNRAIGGVPFGLPRSKVVARLSELLGTRSENPPRNTGCGPAYTEVAWRHLYVELRRGRLTGFRYIENGWPPSRAGGYRIAGGLPLLLTSRKITLGSTLGQARSAYGRLRPVGTSRWQTPDGLVLYDDAQQYPDPPSSRITEIKYGTCGDF